MYYKMNSRFIYANQSLTIHFYWFDLISNNNKRQTEINVNCFNSIKFRREKQSTKTNIYPLWKHSLAWCVGHINKNKNHRVKTDHNGIQTTRSGAISCHLLVRSLQLCERCYVFAVKSASINSEPKRTSMLHCLHRIHYIIYVYC